MMTSKERICGIDVWNIWKTIEEKHWWAGENEVKSRAYIRKERGRGGDTLIGFINAEVPLIHKQS